MYYIIFFSQLKNILITLYLYQKNLLYINFKSNNNIISIKITCDCIVIQLNFSVMSWNDGYYAVINISLQYYIFFTTQKFFMTLYSYLTNYISILLYHLHIYSIRFIEILFIIFFSIIGNVIILHKYHHNIKSFFHSSFNHFIKLFVRIQPTLRVLFIFPINFFKTILS